MSIASGNSRSFRGAFALMTCLLATTAAGQATRHQHGPSNADQAPTFVASTAKPFSALMDDAMAVMDDGMKRAPMDGVAEHDFVTMMIPHHQGAVDMAKSLLLYSKDPELRNLAQGIITEQQNEIKVMQAWLRRYQAARSKSNPSSINKKE